MRLPTLYYVDLSSGLLPIIASLPRLRPFGKPAVVILIFLAGGFATELASYALAMQSIHNLWLMNLYNAFEFTLPVIFFFLVEHNQMWKRSYLWIWAVFLVIWCVAKFSFEPLSSAAEYTHTLSCGILSVYAVHNLVGLMKEEDPFGRLDYRFWSAVAILFYFAGNIALFGAGNALSQLTAVQAFSILQYHWILDMTTNLIFTLGFVWKPRS